MNDVFTYQQLMQIIYDNRDDVSKKIENLGYDIYPDATFSKIDLSLYLYFPFKIFFQCYRSHGENSFGDDDNDAYENIFIYYLSTTHSINVDTGVFNLTKKVWMNYHSNSDFSILADLIIENYKPSETADINQKSRVQSLEFEDGL
jgi:hypothetical protein